MSSANLFLEGHLFAHLHSVKDRQHHSLPAEVAHHELQDPVPTADLLQWQASAHSHAYC